MRIAVTGSIATDHLMVFPGSFREQLIEGSLENVSLSFLADSLDVRRGGVAANITFGLGRLGLRPLLVGAAGTDFDAYRVWLKSHNVDTDSVWISDTRHTARFVCTTDREHNQIATFYPGAMTEAVNISIGQVAERAGGLDLVLVSPDDPAAMVRHTRESRSLGLAFAADPSQQLATLNREDARVLLDGARYLFTNEYEAALLQERTGWQAEEILGRVGSWVTTLGSEGVRIDSVSGGVRTGVRVPALPVGEAVDPTGVGDAFRAGFLAGASWQLGAERSAQLGCVVAAAALGSVGTQTYGLRSGPMVDAIGQAYGAAAAEDLAPHLAGVV